MDNKERKEQIVNIAHSIIDGNFDEKAFENNAQLRQDVINYLKETSFGDPNNQNLFANRNPNYVEDIIKIVPEACDRPMYCSYPVKMISTSVNLNYKNVSSLIEKGNNSDSHIKWVKNAFHLQVEMYEEYVRYSTDENVKLRDIKQECFINPDFYNDIVEIVKSRLQKQFKEATAGIEMTEELEEKFQGKIEKQLAKATKELEGYRQIALKKQDKKLMKEEKNKQAEAKKALRNMGKGLEV